MQKRLPLTILGQIFRNVSRQKNMPGIAAIEYSLADVNSRSCYVRLVINIDDSIDRTAVNSHSHLNVRMMLQGFADLKGTSHRLFRTVEKKKRHPVSGWHSNEFARCLCCPKTCAASHDLIEFLE